MCVCVFVYVCVRACVYVFVCVYGRNERTIYNDIDRLQIVNIVERLEKSKSR